VMGRDVGMAVATRLQLAVRFLERGPGGAVETLSPAFDALLP